MNKPTLCFALAVALLAGAAGAEEARRVADLAGGDFAQGSGQGPYVSLGTGAGHRFVFAADDARHGRELWVSDGTEAGTRLVLDVCPGRCASDPRDITRVGDQAYFFADDGAWPHALYVTDGTAQGTRRVHELSDAVSWPTTTVAMGDLFVFNLSTEAYGNEVFRSDGTREGTRRIADRCPGPCSDDFYSAVATGEGLFWRDASTGRLVHLNPAGDTLQTLGVCAPCSSHPVEIGGKALVVARAGSGYQLLRLAGTQGATQVLASFLGPAETYFGPFIRSRGKLYFLVQSAFTANKLYATDGTPQGTGEVDVPSALGFSFALIGDPSPLADVPMLLLHNAEEGRLYAYRPGIGFRIISGTYLPPAWVGHTSDTIFVTFFPHEQLYWTGDEMALQGELVLADKAVVDLGESYVALRLDFGNGFEPWRFRAGDFTPIRDIAADGERSSNPEPFAVADGYLAVLDPQPADEPGPATNLYKVDDAATQATPWASHSFQAFEPGAGGLFLLRGEANGLYFSDGAAQPAAMGPDLLTIARGRRAGTVERIYFTTDRIGQDVWTSDGTAAGTREIHDPHPGYQPNCPILCPPDLRPIPFRIMGDEAQAFWTGGGQEFANELWRVDAAGNGPRLLAEEVWEPFPLLVWRGTFYYLQWVGDTGSTADGVWQLQASDGQQTRVVRTLTAPAPYHFFADFLPRSLTAGLGDAIYFVIDGNRDTRLWRSDGTEAGTVVVRDLGAGARTSELVATADGLYLAAATPEHGAELWVSDGTTAGTARLDLRPGPLGSHPSELQALADGRLLFAADDGTHGHEPWISDGTLAGTRLLDDLGPGASSPGHWASKGSRVLFAADDGVSGRELYAIDLAPALPPCPADRLCLQEGRFEVQVAFAAPNGASGIGQRALTSESSGVFTFFSPDNWELTVKVLDGCTLNDRFWVFAAATTDVRYDLTVVDRATGASKTWRNPQGTLAAAVADTGAFATCAATAPAPRYGLGSGLPQAARLCPGDASALCLGEEGRFRVRVAWETEDGAEGEAEPVPYGSQDSGLFTFFSADNWELMVKVLDGCALNGQHWLFAAGTTNVGWTLTLEDRQGLLPIRTYTNPVGTASAAIADTAAMACTPP